LPGESYAPLLDAQAWFDMTDQVTGAFLKTDASFGSLDSLYQLDRVGRVTSKAHLVDEFVEHLKEIAGIVYLAFAFSLVVAVLFLFSTSAYGVLRRLAEYSTLRTIGFADSTVLKMIMMEVATIGAVGTLGRRRCRYRNLSRPERRAEPRRGSRSTPRSPPRISWSCCCRH
jgi:ABC-type lipoprotein release transport system permease subunit